MNKYFYKIIICAMCILCHHISYGQDSLANKKRIVYKLKPKVDIPIIAVCGGWAGYMLTQIYSKGPSTTQQILSLNINSIDPLDRLAVYPYNEKMDKMSYYPFYTAFPLPMVLALTGKRMRNDFLKIGFLYLESLSVTGFLGGSATYFVNQYRPYAYTLGTTMGQKMSQNAKNAFYAGHVEVIGVSTFFISEIYAGYYPESKIKWLFFVLAGAATAGMGYVRIDAGMHFPSDVLLGGCAGAASGIMIPYFHNHKILRNSGLALSPFGSATAQGLSMTYTFNK
jgi:membrane-associated phospholipid phosphatase